MFGSYCSEAAKKFTIIAAILVHVEAYFTAVILKHDYFVLVF